MKLCSKMRAVNNEQKSSFAELFLWRRRSKNAFYCRFLHENDMKNPSTCMNSRMPKKATAKIRLSHRREGITI